MSHHWREKTLDTKQLEKVSRHCGHTLHRLADLKHLFCGKKRFNMLGFVSFSAPFLPPSFRGGEVWSRTVSCQGIWCTGCHRTSSLWCLEEGCASVASGSHSPFSLCQDGVCSVAL